MLVETVLTLSSSPNPWYSLEMMKTNDMKETGARYGSTLRGRPTKVTTSITTGEKRSKNPSRF